MILAIEQWRIILAQFIEIWEGMAHRAYQCSADVWTLGMGTTVYPDGTLVQEGDTCTTEQAYEYFEHDIEARAAIVMQMINPAEWREGTKFAMLMSLAYNIGTNALNESTVLKRINQGYAEADIREAWGWWCKAGGKTVRGLVNRRNAELKMIYD